MRTETLALLGVLDAVCDSVDQLATALTEAFRRHPDYEIITSYIAAVCQIRHDTPGRRYYLRKLAEGKTSLEACAAYAGDGPMSSTGSSSPTARRWSKRVREGTRGRL
jgi:hypothetical protein